MNRVLLSYMALHGIEKPEMAAAMGMCITTFYNRLREPDTFTIGELKRAAKKFKVTLVQLMGVTA